MNDTHYRAYICCGPNCGPKGSGGLLDYLEAELARLGLSERINALPTGCQSHCDSGPTMVVYPGPVYYQGISEERLDRIVQEHFVRGEPVKEYFWTGVRRRILPGQDSNAPREAPSAALGREDRKPIEAKKPPRKAPDVDDFKW